MSAEQKSHRKKKSGAAKPAKNTKQLAIVAVLLLGLFIAVLTSPTAPEEAHAPAAEVQLTPLALTPMPQEVIVEPHPAFVRTETLPSLDGSHWAGLDPFAPIPVAVESVAPPAPSDEPTSTEAVGEPELAIVDVQAIYGRGGDAVALIGGSVVRVGERLPDGRRVVSVTAEGVELAK